MRYGVYKHGRQTRRSLGYRQTGRPERFYAYSVAAVWDAALGITLNGNDVSAIASQVAGAADLPQATAANQPLYIGAPAYNGNPSIQFTAANGDRLQANINIIGAAQATYIAVIRARAAVDQFWLSNVNNTATAGWAFGSRTAGTLRDTVAVGVSARTAGVIGTTQPEVWVGRDYAAASPVTALSVNNVPMVVTAAAAVRTTPGATPRLVLGSLVDAVLPADIDFLYAAIATVAVDDSVVTRLSHALMARFTGG